MAAQTSCDFGGFPFSPSQHHICVFSSEEKSRLLPIAVLLANNDGEKR
jgi:hypothetical protein